MKHLNKNRLIRLTIGFWKNTIGSVLIYSLLYFAISETFTNTSYPSTSARDEYLTVSQTRIEVNLNDRSQRIKLSDQSRFNLSNIAINSDRVYSQYTKYFIAYLQSSISFLYFSTNSNNSFRAPPQC